jgi:aspartyl-tRNA(Asn)/glutamyl-tRNA(Gln) amidotransferase subunit B
MEKGSMRLEANISWGLEWGYKVEVKNLNSFRFVDKAINFELERQKKLLEKGVIPAQETRGWSEADKATITQRYKEEAADYRYFPEPDIPPMEFSNEFIRKVQSEIPELPSQKAKRLVKEFGIRESYVDIFVSDKKTAEVAERLLSNAAKKGLSPDTLASKIINQKIDILTLDTDKFLEKSTNKVSEKIKDESEISNFIQEAVNELPKVVSDYKKGKLNALSVIIGKVMQISKGKADPMVTRTLLEAKLKES